MGYYTQENFRYDQVLLYSRKSQSDDPGQTVEEVLEKHNTMLQEYAERELGGKIPEENIYKEVVSGESIDGRVEIKKVLARIEDPNIKAVLVVEPQRLSRGDLEDCGRLINTLRFTKTQVLTLMMTYDLENKMERKFFQDELMRGRDYLEYVKEILFRGRFAAAKRGEFIMATPPYGYRKIVNSEGKNTLEIVEDEAMIVRQIFDWRVNHGLGTVTMARRLDEMAVKPPRGDYWPTPTIAKILENKHYLGLIVFNEYKKLQVMEKGVVKKKKIKQKPEDALIVKGLHEAIIDQETWDTVQSMKKVADPRHKKGTEMKNPFSGILYCSNCGRVMIRQTSSGRVRYRCPKNKMCFASMTKATLDAAVIDALEYSELPELQLKVVNDDGASAKIQEKQLKKLEQKLAEYIEQEETQYELLELKKYTQELFDRRHSALRKKMDECRDQIANVKASMPKAIDYAERLATLQLAIDTLKDPAATPEEQNTVLKSIVERIDYTSIPCALENKNKRGPRNAPYPFSITVKLRL